MKTGWEPASWRALESAQMATYDDKAAYDSVINKLSKLPPLVQPGECKRLIALLAEAGRGERFVVQGGDCAERFIDCEPDRIAKQCEVLMQMGALIQLQTSTPVVTIARLAGQYGKPRSKPTENVDGWGEIYSFKGDNINGYEPKDRTWDPKRLLEGYWHSAATLNYVRSLQASAEEKEALLKSVDLSTLASSEFAAEASALGSSLCTEAPQLAPGCEMFTSHEGMQLDLEECLTRQTPGGPYYNLSTHFLWIGDRTRQLHMGHIEYFRGIANPIGCKTGPSMKPEELKELVQILNPDKIEGKLVIITRYGASKVRSILPGHIKAVQEAGVPVVWQVDGVHGNTVSAKAEKAKGLKTRALDDVVTECLEALAVHRECGSILGGMHIELTGQRGVTECVGGACGLTEDDLPRCYETYCDPRFNYSQALEAALRVGKALKK